MILVTGATGQIGATLVELLADRGAGVRAMVRTPDRAAGSLDARAAVAVADFDDPERLRAALDGTDAVFLNTPSSERAAERQIRVADLAVDAGVPRLVLLSQLAADASSPVRFLRWHAAVEAHVHDLPIEVTVLRGNLFLQGLLTMADPIARHGRFGAPIGDARVSMVDTRDIAEVAAVVLTEPGHDGATYTLTGPEAVTHAEAAAALAAATGHPVTFSDLDEDTFAGMLDGVLPPWQRAGLLEDYAHYRRGEAAAVDPAVATLLGRPARDVSAFARDHADRFRPAAVR